MDGCSRQDPAYRPAKGRPRISRGLPIPAAGPVSGLRRLGQRADLLEEARHVHELPLLGQLSVLAAAQSDTRDGDLAAGRSHSEEVAVVGAADREARGDVVAARELVVDRHRQVWQAAPDGPDHVEQTVDSPVVLGNVDHEVRAQDLLKPGPVAPTRLRVALTGEGLV